MRRLARAASLIVAAAIVPVAPPAAHAQRAEKKSARERSSQSREAYDAGKKAYNLGDFERAIELWKQGYEYKDDPIFLYNIAQAYRQRGDHQKAIFFYKAYTREEPKARNRAEVDARIAELSKLIEAQQSASEAPPKEPVGPPEAPRPDLPPAPEPEPPAAAVVAVHDDAVPDIHPGFGLKVGGLVAGALGVAVAATGVVFLLRSASIEGELEDAAASGMPWNADLVDKENDGRTAQTLGWIGVGVGTAAMVTGLTLYLMGAQKDGRARREQAWLIAPMVGDARGVVATFSF